MIKAWADVAWEDFLYWHEQDKKTLKRIFLLLKDIDRHPFEGIGRPEPLKENLAGYWSRETDKKNRIVYSVSEDTIYIVQCGSHYGDK